MSGLILFVYKLIIEVWRDNLLLFSYFAFADSLVLTSLSRKQPVDLLSVNLFVKSLLYLVFGVWSTCKKPLSTCVAFESN